MNDLAYLKLRPYRLSTLASRVNEKLAPKFYGPFPVIQCVGQVAYKLQLPPTSFIHPVFHISQLWPVVRIALPTLALPPQLSEDLELLLEPVEVLGYRMTGTSIPYDVDVRPEKFQFLKKGQNRNFGYKILISVKNPEFIL